MQKSSQQTPPKPAKAGKLTIRRKGGCAPTMCLALLLLLIGLISWLSIWGLPQSALRSIEEAAAKEGCHIRLGGVYLAPASGLAVRVKDVELYTAADAPEPIATVGDALAELRIGPLLSGDFTPRRVAVSAVAIKVPVSDSPGEHLALTSPELAFRISRNGILSITEGDFDLNGISLRVVGNIRLPKEDDEEEPTTEEEDKTDSGPFGLAQELEPYQQYIDSIHHAIRMQQWRPGEFPDIDIQPKLQDREQVYHIRLSAPRVDVDEFHFRKAEAQLTCKAESIVVDKLSVETVEPDSRLRVQGGYVVNTRELGFSITSNAPLLPLANRFAAEQIGPVFGKLRHEENDAMEVQLSGNVRLDEENHPENLRLSGSIIQRNLYIGDSRVDTTELSFNYSNGDFVLEKCTLTLPGGRINLSANGKGGQGGATLEGDIDVDALLHIASEFTEEPVALPEGLGLKGNTRFKITADLDVPPFIPGEKPLVELIPKVNAVDVQADVEGLTYSGYALQAPSVKLHLDGVDQDDAEIPTAIATATLSVGAESVSVPLEGDSGGLRLEGVGIRLQSEGIELHDLEEASPDILLPTAQGGITIARVEQGDWSVSEAGLRLEGLENIRPLNDPEYILDKVTLAFTAKEIRHADTPLGSAGAGVSYSTAKPDTATLELTFHPSGAESPLRLTATADWVHRDTPELRDIEAKDWALDGLAPIFEHFETSLYGFHLPRSLTLTGDLRFDAKEGKLKDGGFSLEIPELVREPVFVKALAGKQETISVELKGDLFTLTNGPLAYQGDLVVRHETGRLDARIQGSGAKLGITGRSSLRADVVDVLADYSDAHEIIRDFRFNPQSTSTMEDLSVILDFTDSGGGRRVTFRCDADARNVDYVMFALENDEEGNEHLRTDLGEDPFTHLLHCTCTVMVDVAYGCHNAKGELLPDECVIQMGNCMMEFDNEPWLRKQGFQKGAAKSVLHGDLVYIDVEKEYAEIHNVRGTIYPAYSIGMFYSDMYDFMSDIIVPEPVLMETTKCVFPYSSEAPVPFSGSISVLGKGTDILRMFGTDIPLEDVSGFVHLTNDAVLLDRLNANCWDGVVNAVISIGFSNMHTSIDGYATASCVNLRRVMAAYDVQQADALCHGRIRFRGAAIDLPSLEAYGDLEITDGDLLSLYIFSPVNELLSDIPTYFAKLENHAVRALGYKGDSDYISRALKSTGSMMGKVGSGLDGWVHYVPFANHIIAYSLKHARGTFTIKNGHLLTKDLEATGTNLTVNANLDIDLDSMQLRGNIWPRLYSLPAIAIQPLTFLSKYIIDIKVRGPVNDIKWGVGLDSRLKGAPSSASSEKKP